MEGCQQLCLHGLPSQGGRIDKHTFHCHSVNSHECLWPFNFAEAWLRHATLRTKHLVLDVHLPKEGFAFPAGVVQISGLNDGCCFLPQITSVDLYLYGLRNTLSLLSKNRATTA